MSGSIGVLQRVAQFSAPLTRAAYSRFASLPLVSGLSCQMDSPPDRLANIVLGYGHQVERLKDLHARGVTLTDNDLTYLCAHDKLTQLMVDYDIDPKAPMQLPPYYVLDHIAIAKHPKEFTDMYTLVRREMNPTQNVKRRVLFGYGGNEKMVQAMLRWIQGYPALAKPLVESIEQSFKALDRVPYSIEQAIPFIYLFFSNATVVSQIQAWAAAKPPLIERLIAEDYMRNLEALRDARFGCLMKQDELPVVYRRTLLPFDAWMLTGQELSIQHLIGQKALSASMFITAD